MTKEQILNAAELAKMRILEEGIEELAGSILGAMEYMMILESMALDDVDPTYEVNNHTQTLREDVVKEGLTREEVLQNSIENQYGYFKLLKIVE